MTATYDLFQHEWSGGCTLESTWQTVVDEAPDTLAEERTALRGKPARFITVRWLAATRAEAQRILFALARSGKDSVRVPLYCDQAETTAVSSGTTIHCPTAYRRFQVGQMVAIHEIVGGRATNVQYRLIDAVGGASLTLTAGLTGNYPAGSLVYPIVLAHVRLASDLDFVTGQVVAVDATFREVLGAAALDALEAPLDAPVVFPTATVEGETYPVFDLLHNWGETFSAGFLSPGDSYDRGRGHQVAVRGARPLWRWGVSLLFDTREAAWAAVQFCDAMRGKLGAFWFPFPGYPWLATGYDAAYVEIEPAGNIEDVQELLTHVAVYLDDGSIVVREIQSVTLVAGDWRIVPTAAFPAGTLGDVVKVCPCALVRFESDSFEEQWLTTEVLRLQVSVRELMNEASVASISTPEACP